ncbi:MAG: Ig-like domain-containing protein [Caldilineaceae bacterium]
MDSFARPTILLSNQPMRWWTALLFTLLCSLLSFTAAQASSQAESTATIVNQDITTNTIWNKAGSPYNVTQFVSVRAGVTLTVEAGVQVVFSKNVQFSVQGVLVTKGTANEPVIFTGAEKKPGAWNGINASNNAEQPAQIQFQHTIVEYATYVGMENNGNLELNNAVADIRNSIFRFSGGNGLVVSGAAKATIADSAFTNNTLDALRISYAAKNDPVLSNLSAGGNGGSNAVVYVAGFIDHIHTLEKMGLPYVFKGGMNVQKTGQLILSPGVEVQVETGFYVDGQLTAIGTAAQPILITGINQQANGWWGLRISGDFQQLAQATLDYVTIEYGGNGTDDSDANLSVGTANVTVTHSLIRNGSHHGIYDDGGSPDQPFTITISDTTISNNGGDALACYDESCNLTLNNLTVSGNGRNGIVHNGAMAGDVLWRNLGLPYYVEGQGGVGQDSILTIDPGVEVRMGKDANFQVDGALFANGTPAQPITFTGSSAQPGWWERIQIEHEGFVEMQYCDIGYGGGNQPQGFNFGQLHFNSSAAYISDCRIHHSAKAGVSISGNSQPILLYNRIEANQSGLTANFSLKQPDVRYNWWGSPSGPTHADNQGGSGQAIEGDVIYKPFLTDPNERTAAGGLEVDVTGPGRFAPGDIEQYSVTYRNLSGQTVENAVVRLALPGHSELVETSPGGIYWLQRNQVFWKLGNLANGKGGALYIKVRYDWGLEEGLKGIVVAQLGGSNLTSSRFDVAPYLDFVPRSLTSSTDLTAQQVQAERNANPVLEQLYQQALNLGFVAAGGERHVYSTGEQETELILLRFQPSFASFRLSLVNGKVIGILVEGSSYTVYRGSGALRYDLQSNSWLRVSNNELTAAALGATTTIDWSDCMENCIAEKIPGYLVKKHIKILSDASKAISCVKAASDPNSTEAVLGCAKYLKKIAPGASEAIDLGQCNLDCQACEESGMGCKNPLCHCCTEDSYRCDADDFIYGTFADLEVVKRRKCVIEEGEEGGKYLAEEVIKVCALCEKCINNGNQMACVAKNGGFLLQTLQTYAAAMTDQHVTAELAITAGGSDLECDECRKAKDPNELYGPEGDLLPGQLVSYTVAYENVGAGNANGVFIVYKLDAAFDLNTLTVYGDAQISKNARTIFWTVGDLNPKGEVGSGGMVSFTVKLRSGLASGTLISNQAVVHFPSVPEETPTNVLVNRIQPLIAEGQSLEATIGSPLAITLKGRDVQSAPLTYAIVEAPAYGTMSGSAPNLVYTPNEQSVGGDRIRFTVSNGASTSAIGTISIQVKPSSSDKNAPKIVWTAPSNNETLPLKNAAALQDGQVLFYYPVLQVQFSEAMQSATVTNTTILVTAAGQPLAADVRYEGSSQQALIFLRQQPQPGTLVTVTLTNGVKDVMGNPLATAHSWSFTVTDASETPSDSKLFLPVISR